MRNKGMLKVLCGFVFLLFFLVNVLPAAAQDDQSTDFIFKGKLVNGKIKEVDVAENIVKVDSASGEVMELVFMVDETVVWIDDDEKALSDIEIGMEAELKYTENERDQKVLSWIDIVLNESLVDEPVSEPQMEAVQEEKPLVAAVQGDAEGVLSEPKEAAEAEVASVQIDKKTVENTGSKSQ